MVVDLDTPKPGIDVPARWRQPGIVDCANVLAGMADHAGRSMLVTGSMPVLKSATLSAGAAGAAKMKA